MSALSGARCVGQWWLFDSVDLYDHEEAAAICAQCPVRLACFELLVSERSVPMATYGGPIGTWAGELVGTKAKAREHGTERGWGQHRHYREQTCQDCRVAHALHNAARAQKVAS